MYSLSPHDKNTAGFSLVELSIVLVILGLLTGGILGGQSLIKAAELRSVTTEMQDLNRSLYSFRDKYFTLPGDMKNAVKFWGAAAGGLADGTDASCVALGYASPSTGTETCNGDGNGEIAAGPEMMRIWQHLANAGLINGTYTGVSYTSSSNRNHKAGVNCPKSKYAGNAGYSMYFLSSAPSYNFPGQYGHVFLFGRDETGYATIGGIMPPEDAWNIDTKMDDGKPGTGKIRPRNIEAQGHPNCSTSSDPAVSEYNLDDTTSACGLHFISGM